LFAHVLRIKLNLAGRVFVDPSRNADAARFSECFQSRGDIDPVTKEVTVFDDDIPLVHRHPELQELPRGGGRVPVLKGILDSDSGAQRQDCTWELGKHAVSHQLEDAPALFCDEGLDDLGAQLPQPLDRANFVLPDQTAEADHIGCQDRNKPSLDEGLICHTDRASGRLLHSRPSRSQQPIPLPRSNGEHARLTERRRERVQVAAASA
jgi:hypothetical protein